MSPPRWTWRCGNWPAGSAPPHETLDADPGSLAHRYRAGTLPPVAQQGLAAFLDRYGHRAVAEIDLGLPRWSEDPRHVLGVLLNYQRLDNSAAAPDAVFAAGARQAEEMTATLIGRARGGLRRRAVRFALGRARALAGLREFPKYYLIVVLAAVRRQLSVVGTELATAGRIGTADDVFFLDPPEIRAALARQRPACPDRRSPRGVRPGNAPPACAPGAALRRHRAGA
nr:hypothetical protein GCM10020092_051870 [Actinoplanes digitatis]